MNDRLKKNIDVAPEIRSAFEGRYEMHWEDAAIHTQMLWRDAWQDAREAAGQEAVAWIAPGDFNVFQECKPHEALRVDLMRRQGQAHTIPIYFTAPAAPPAQVATRQLTEQAIADAVTKWFPDRAYQAPFFARELLKGDKHE